MSDCIWIHYARPRPHWYGLDEADQAEKRARWQAVADASAQKGGIWLGTWHVRGQHDYETVELWRFPSAESAFQHWSDLTVAAYGEFHAFANNIGLRGGAAP